MAFDLKSLTAEAVVKAPRILLLGVEKIGKTTFACGSKVEDGQVVDYGLNSPVILPVRGEEGANDIPVTKTPVANSIDDVMGWIEGLYSQEHDHQTIVIDSASALEPLIFDSVCRAHNVKSIEKVGGGYGKGYTEALALWRELTEGLDALRTRRNMASIIIGHVKIKRFDDPAGDSYDQYQFDIHEKAANLLFRWADLILFANTKVVVKKEEQGFGKTKARGIDAGQRFLFTQKKPAHPGGGRGIYGQLPYELPLDWQSFAEATSEIINNTTTGENNE